MANLDQLISECKECYDNKKDDTIDDIFEMIKSMKENTDSKILNDIVSFVSSKMKQEYPTPPAEIARALVVCLNLESGQKLQTLLLLLQLQDDVAIELSELGTVENGDASINTLQENGYETDEFGRVTRRQTLGERGINNRWLSNRGIKTGVNSIKYDDSIDQFDARNQGITDRINDWADEHGIPEDKAEEMRRTFQNEHEDFENTKAQSYIRQLDRDWETCIELIY